MDGSRFDALARALAGLTNRRGLLSVAVSLPVVRGGLALLGLEDAEAKKRRKRNHDNRKQDNHARNGKRRDHDVDAEKKKANPPVQCAPEAQSVTCSGKCGSVMNTCQQAVNCGTCVCNPPVHPGASAPAATPVCNAPTQSVTMVAAPRQAPSATKHPVNAACRKRRPRPVPANAAR